MSGSNKSLSKRFNKPLLILLIILIILFIFSLIILVLRLGDFLPNGIDILFIEPKEPGLLIDDNDVVWDGETKVDIFEIKSENDQGIVTVLSGTGDKIIAPGTEGYYKFNFKNIGNIAIDYDCVMKVYFETTENIDVDTIPINVRLKDYNGNYLVGSNDSWENVLDAQEIIDKQTIGKKSYVFYELEWQWEYESGNDELDTFLGNLSNSSSIKLVVEIACVAIQSQDHEAVGGLQSDIDEIRTGGNLVLVPYLLLNLLILIILIILLVSFKNKKEKSSKILKETILGDSPEDPSQGLQ